MSTEPYTVKTLLKHEHMTILHVHLAPGHATPKHSHAHDYIVRPHQDTTLTKTTYKDGAVVGTETVEHKAGVPYPVAKSEDGTEFTITNSGTAAMLCDKSLIHPKA